LAGVAPLAARAQVTVARCPVENAQVSVTFNGSDTSVTVARAKLDAKMAEVKSLAQEQQFTKLVVQSHNYNISTAFMGANGGEPHYQYNATISFAIQPSEKAVDFMQMLAKKGYQTTVNVNSYNNGMCGQNGER
jgi:hypothetical protein